MNAISPVAGMSMALVPQNLTEAMKLAELMSKAKLLPQAVQNPADAFMIINQALRWGMDPFAVAQEVSVIQGKMMHSGKIVAAAIHTSGILEGRLSYDYQGSNGEMSVTVTGRLRGESEPRSVTVKLKEARTNNGHWQKSPEQMLAYHAARVWARRHAPEVMLGVYAPEEFDEAPAAEPKPVEAKVEKPAPNRAEPKPVPSRAEVDRILGDDDGEFAPLDKARDGATALEARIRAAASEDELHAIAGESRVGAQLTWLAKHRPELHALVNGAMAQRYADLVAAKQDAEGDAAEPEAEEEMSLP